MLLRLQNILKRRTEAEPAPQQDVKFGNFTFNLARGELRIIAAILDKNRGTR